MRPSRNRRRRKSYRSMGQSILVKDEIDIDRNAAFQNKFGQSLVPKTTPALWECGLDRNSWSRPLRGFTFFPAINQTVKGTYQKCKNYLYSQEAFSKSPPPSTIMKRRRPTFSGTVVHEQSWASYHCRAAAKRQNFRQKKAPRHAAAASCTGHRNPNIRLGDTTAVSGYRLKAWFICQCTTQPVVIRNMAKERLGGSFFPKQMSGFKFMHELVWARYNLRVWWDWLQPGLNRQICSRHSILEAEHGWLSAFWKCQMARLNPPAMSVTKVLTSSRHSAICSCDEQILTSRIGKKS